MTYRENRTVGQVTDICLPVFEPEAIGRPRQRRREAAAAERRTRFYEAFAAAVTEETARRRSEGTHCRCRVSFTVRETGWGTAVDVTVTFRARGARPSSRVLTHLWREDVLVSDRHLSKKARKDAHSS
ncbi:MAG: hypothetical protein MJ088_01215 [Clostridia bacterium]|nr:hypothetical protein [Clostridia bacterium]